MALGTPWQSDRQRQAAYRAAQDARPGAVSSWAPALTAADSYAAVTRDQWQSYVQNFVPMENKLIEYANDPSVVANAMETAGQTATSAFDARQASTERRLRGMGVALDAEEQNAANRQFGLTKSLTDVNARNMAGAAARQRQQSILGNPVPSAGAFI